MPMEITNKVDLIDELSDLVEATGGKVILISQNSEEGDSLTAAFNGIAGVARYPIDV
jgi:peptide subunit release factor 1 (eRF1)